MTVSSGGLLTETWNAIAPLLAVTTGPASCPPGCCMPRDVPGSRHGPQGNTARVLVIGSGQQIEGFDEVGPGVAGLARGLFQRERGVRLPDFGDLVVELALNALGGLGEHSCSPGRSFIDD